MPDFITSIRQSASYGYGYLSGRAYALPRSFSDFYAQAVSKGTSFVTLSLPFLSAIAVPIFGGYSTTVNALFFYLAWSSLVLSYGELKVELYGTLLLRLVLFCLPASIFLAFDALFPGPSKRIKSRGFKHHPTKLEPKRLWQVIGWSLFNVVSAVAFQGVLEILCTRVLHLKSLIIVQSFTTPFPWTIIKDLILGFILRGAAHYTIHRCLLHSRKSALKTWHLNWQHGSFPFSMVAAYDHPACHLLAQWFPTFLPAYLFRWHALTWFIFVALTSLEDLFVYSGYSDLPSKIILAGMARRTEAHFESVKRKQPGNFGHIGILDLVCGTSCKEEPTVMDDFKDEAEKRRFQERVEFAVQEALAGIDRKRNEKPENGQGTVGGADAQDDDDEDIEKDEDTNGPSAIGQAAGKVADLVTGPRRSGRKKAR